MPQGRGHARNLSRAQIIDAALELARKGGDRALSMRRVAGALSVDASALYWHFRNKQELMAEVARAAAARVSLEAPTEGSWQDRATTLCWSIHEQLYWHPELGPSAGGSPWTTPFQARAFSLLVSVLSESGLSGPPLLYAAQGLLHQVTATADSQRIAKESPLGQVRAYMDTVTRNLPEDVTEEWQRVNHEPVDEGFEAYLAEVIAMWIEGIARRAKSARSESLRGLPRRADQRRSSA